MTSSHLSPVPCQWFALLPPPTSTKGLGPDSPCCSSMLFLARGRRTVTSWILRRRAQWPSFDRAIRPSPRPARSRRRSPFALVLTVVEPSVARGRATDDRTGRHTNPTLRTVRRAAPMGQALAGPAGQATLGGGRRGVRQGRVPQAGDGDGNAMAREGLGRLWSKKARKRPVWNVAASKLVY